MSVQSRTRNDKRPTGNARRALRRQVGITPTNVSTNGGRTFIKKAVPFGLVSEPGHRPLALIPPPRRGGYRLYPEQPVAKGAFGGVSKAERRRRFEASKRNLAKKA